MFPLRGGVGSKSGGQTVAAEMLITRHDCQRIQLLISDDKRARFHALAERRLLTGAFPKAVLRLGNVAIKEV